MWCLYSAALAASPLNGNFTDGLDNWTVDAIVGDTVVAVVEEGSNFSDNGDSSGLNFPSNPRALMLKGGTSGAFNAAGVKSESFLITRGTLEFRHRSEVAAVVNTWRLRVDGNIVASEEFPAHTAGNNLVRRNIETMPLCGNEVTLQYLQWAAVDGDRFYTLIDSIVSNEGLCADYEDTDGDGFCVHGTDNNVDGDCEDDLEAEPSSNPVIDCDEGEATVFPGADEIVDDGIDQDCDGTDLTGECYEDLDLDGFGMVEITSTLACTGPGESPIGGDCNDADPEIRPGAEEIPLDGIDQDCNGGDVCYIDADQDGYGQVLAPGSLGCDLPGEATVPGDCDDERPQAFPGAPELCNGVDDDCDGTTDPGEPMDGYLDNDGDGFGFGAVQVVCGATLGVVENDIDCNDDDGDIFPGALEIPGDLVDSDCSGTEACFDDLDGDQAGGQTVVEGPLDCLGFFTEITDCDDLLAAISPSAVEGTADGVDQNCDGQESCYADVDDDGFGSTALVQSTDLDCDDLGESILDTDCDDERPQIGPGMEEIPDNDVDENCDGLAEQTPEPPPDPGLDPLSVVYRGGGACSSAPLSGLWWMPLALFALRRPQNR